MKLILQNSLEFHIVVAKKLLKWSVTGNPGGGTHRSGEIAFQPMHFMFFLIEYTAAWSCSSMNRLWRNCPTDICPFSLLPVSFWSENMISTHGTNKNPLSLFLLSHSLFLNSLWLIQSLKFIGGTRCKSSIFLHRLALFHSYMFICIRIFG
jgi:hypothetical protein